MAGCKTNSKEMKLKVSQIFFCDNFMGDSSGLLCLVVFYLSIELP